MARLACVASLRKGLRKPGQANCNTDQQLPHFSQPPYTYPPPFTSLHFPHLPLALPILPLPPSPPPSQLLLSLQLVISTTTTKNVASRSAIFPQGQHRLAQHHHLSRVCIFHLPRPINPTNGAPNLSVSSFSPHYSWHCRLNPILWPHLSDRLQPTRVRKSRLGRRLPLSTHSRRIKRQAARRQHQCHQDRYHSTTHRATTRHEARARTIRLLVRPFEAPVIPAAPDVPSLPLIALSHQRMPIKANTSPP